MMRDHRRQSPESSKRRQQDVRRDLREDLTFVPPQPMTNRDSNIYMNTNVNLNPNVPSSSNYPEYYSSLPAPTDTIIPRTRDGDAPGRDRDRGIARERGRGKDVDRGTHRDQDRIRNRGQDEEWQDDHEQQRSFRQRAASESSGSYTSSSASSFLDISRHYPDKTRFGGILGTFWRAPSERRVRRRRSGLINKRRVLYFGNSSSSSVNSDLAYGTGFIARRKNRNSIYKSRATSGSFPANETAGRDRQRINEYERSSVAGPSRPGRSKRDNTDAEILAIGRKLSGIARKQNDRDLRTSGKFKASGLAAAAAAVNEVRQKRRDTRLRGIGSSRQSHGAYSDSGDDSEWEDASDEEGRFSDAESALAYGSVVSQAIKPTQTSSSSRMPTSALGAGVAAMVGLFGASSKRTDRLSAGNGRKSSVVDPRLFGPQNSLRGMINTPCGFNDGKSMADHQQFNNLRRADTAPVHQGPARGASQGFTSDTDRLGVEAMSTTYASQRDLPYRSRPAAIPLQQPSPKVPVSSKVYQAERLEDESKREATKPSHTRSDETGIGTGIKLTGLAAAAAAAVALASDRSSKREARREERRAERKEGLPEPMSLSPGAEPKGKEKETKRTVIESHEARDRDRDRDRTHERDSTRRDKEAEPEPSRKSKRDSHSSKQSDEKEHKRHSHHEEDEGPRKRREKTLEHHHHPEAESSRKSKRSDRDHRGKERERDGDRSTKSGSSSKSAKRESRKHDDREERRKEERIAEDLEQRRKEERAAQAHEERRKEERAAQAHVERRKEERTADKVTEQYWPTHSIVDPFQFQIHDDDSGFSVPAATAPARPFQPTVSTVDWEHDVHDEPPRSVQSDVRISRRDSFEIQRAAENYKNVTRDLPQGYHPQQQNYYQGQYPGTWDSYEQAKHSTAPIAAATMASAIVVERARSRSRERRRDADYSQLTKDPVQEEADRYYRDLVTAQKIATEEQRSRMPMSSDKSVMDKYDDVPQPRSIDIVTPPEMEEAKSRGTSYPAPDADVQIDNKVYPRELHSFQVGDRSSSVHRSRESSHERERPILNLVYPTPVQSRQQTPSLSRAASEVEDKTASGAKSRGKSQDRDRDRDRNRENENDDGKDKDKKQKSKSRDEPVDDSGVGSKGDSARSSGTSTVSSTAKSVTWGENSTKSFEVERPESRADSEPASGQAYSNDKPRPQLDQASPWGMIATAIAGSSSEPANEPDSKGSRSKPQASSDVSGGHWGRTGRDRDDYNVGAKSEPPIPGPKPVSPTAEKMPGGFADDIEFAATLAAGLKDTGFDPNIVIDDPVYRRRDSPPHSSDPGGDGWNYGDSSGMVKDRTPGTRQEASEPSFSDPIDMKEERTTGMDDREDVSRSLSHKDKKRLEKESKRRSTDMTSESVPAQSMETPPIDDLGDRHRSKKERRKLERARLQSMELSDPLPVDSSQSPEFEDAPESQLPKKEKEKRERGKETLAEETSLENAAEYKDSSRDDNWRPREADDAERKESDRKKSTKSHRSRELDDDSYSRIPARTEYAEEKSAVRMAESDGEWDSHRKSKTKSKSKRHSAGPEIISQSAPGSEFGDKDASSKRSSKSKHRSGTDVDDYGGDPHGRKKEPWEEREVTSVVSEPRVDERHRERRSKRSSTYDDDDAKSIASAPGASRKSKRSSLYGDEENSRSSASLAGSNRRGKDKEPEKSEKKSSGLFASLFKGTSTSTTSSSGSKDGSKKLDRESFLDNAGTLGAGAGLATAAIVASSSRPNATQASSEKEPEARDEVEKARSRSFDDVLDHDPEIAPRAIRPAIDPQYGDLLPLPPSELGSPTTTAAENTPDLADLPALPDSRPDTPPEERILKRDIYSHRRKRSSQETPTKSPSSTAIPIALRLGQRHIASPDSPGYHRPPSSGSPTTAPAATRRECRISWESSKEYKPLFLLEKTRRSSVETGTMLPQVDLSARRPRRLSEPRAPTSKHSSAPDFAKLEFGDASNSALHRDEPADVGLRIDTDLAAAAPFQGATTSQESTPKAILMPELPSWSAAAAAARETSIFWTSADADPVPVDSMSKNRSSYLLSSAPSSTKSDKTAARIDALESSNMLTPTKNVAMQSFMPEVSEEMTSADEHFTDALEGSHSDIFEEARDWLDDGKFSSFEEGIESRQSTEAAQAPVVDVEPVSALPMKEPELEALKSATQPPASEPITAIPAEEPEPEEWKSMTAKERKKARKQRKNRNLALAGTVAATAVATAGVASILMEKPTQSQEFTENVQNWDQVEPPEEEEGKKDGNAAEPSKVVEDSSAEIGTEQSITAAEFDVPTTTKIDDTAKTSELELIDDDEALPIAGENVPESSKVFEDVPAETETETGESTREPDVPTSSKIDTHAAESGYKDSLFADTYVEKAAKESLLDPMTDVQSGSVEDASKKELPESEASEGTTTKSKKGKKKKKSKGTIPQTTEELPVPKIVEDSAAGTLQQPKFVGEEIAPDFPGNMPTTDDIQTTDEPPYAMPALTEQGPSADPENVPSTPLPTKNGRSQADRLPVETESEPAAFPKNLETQQIGDSPSMPNASAGPAEDLTEQLSELGSPEFVTVASQDKKEEKSSSIEDALPIEVSRSSTQDDINTALDPAVSEVGPQFTNMEAELQPNVADVVAETPVTDTVRSVDTDAQYGGIGSVVEEAPVLEQFTELRDLKIDVQPDATGTLAEEAPVYQSAEFRNLETDVQPDAAELIAGEAPVLDQSTELSEAPFAIVSKGKKKKKKGKKKSVQCEDSVPVLDAETAGPSTSAGDDTDPVQATEPSTSELGDNKEQPEIQLPSLEPEASEPLSSKAEDLLEPAEKESISTAPWQAEREVVDDGFADASWSEVAPFKQSRNKKDSWAVSKDPLEEEHVEDQPANTADAESMKQDAIGNQDDPAADVIPEITVIDPFKIEALPAEKSLEAATAAEDDFSLHLTGKKAKKKKKKKGSNTVSTPEPEPEPEPAHIESTEKETTDLDILSTEKEITTDMDIPFTEEPTTIGEHQPSTEASASAPAETPAEEESPRATGKKNKKKKRQSLNVETASAAQTISETPAQAITAETPTAVENVEEAKDDLVQDKQSSAMGKQDEKETRQILTTESTEEEPTTESYTEASTMAQAALDNNPFRADPEATSEASKEDKPGEEKKNTTVEKADVTDILPGIEVTTQEETGKSTLVDDEAKKWDDQIASPKDSVMTDNDPTMSSAITDTGKWNNDSSATVTDMPPPEVSDSSIVPPNSFVNEAAASADPTDDVESFAPVKLSKKAKRKNKKQSTLRDSWPNIAPEPVSEPASKDSMTSCDATPLLEDPKELLTTTEATAVQSEMEEASTDYRRGEPHLKQSITDKDQCMNKHSAKDDVLDSSMPASEDQTLLASVHGTDLKQSAAVDNVISDPDHARDATTASEETPGQERRTDSGDIETIHDEGETGISKEDKKAKKKEMEVDVTSKLVDEAAVSQQAQTTKVGADDLEDSWSESVSKKGKKKKKNKKAKQGSQPGDFSDQPILSQEASDSHCADARPQDHMANLLGPSTTAQSTDHTEAGDAAECGFQLEPTELNIPDVMFEKVPIAESQAPMVQADSIEASVSSAKEDFTYVQDSSAHPSRDSDMPVIRDQLEGDDQCTIFPLTDKEEEEAADDRMSQAGSLPRGQESVPDTTERFVEGSSIQHNEAIPSAALTGNADGAAETEASNKNIEASTDIIADYSGAEKTSPIRDAEMQDEPLSLSLESGITTVGQAMSQQPKIDPTDGAWEGAPQRKLSKKEKRKKKKFAMTSSEQTTSEFSAKSMDTEGASAEPEESLPAEESDENKQEVAETALTATATAGTVPIVDSVELTGAERERSGDAKESPDPQGSSSDWVEEIGGANPMASLEGPSSTTANFLQQDKDQEYTTSKSSKKKQKKGKSRALSVDEAPTPTPTPTISPEILATETTVEEPPTEIEQTFDMAQQSPAQATPLMESGSEAKILPGAFDTTPLADVPAPVEAADLDEWALPTKKKGKKGKKGKKSKPSSGVMTPVDHGLDAEASASEFKKEQETGGRLELSVAKTEVDTPRVDAEEDLEPNTREAKTEILSAEAEQALEPAIAQTETDTLDLDAGQDLKPTTTHTDIYTRLVEAEQVFEPSEAQTEIDPLNLKAGQLLEPSAIQTDVRNVEAEQVLESRTTETEAENLNAETGKILQPTTSQTDIESRTVEAEQVLEPFTAQTETNTRRVEADTPKETDVEDDKAVLTKAKTTKKRDKKGKERKSTGGVTTPDSPILALEPEATPALSPESVSEPIEPKEIALPSVEPVEPVETFVYFTDSGAGEATAAANESEPTNTKHGKVKSRSGTITPAEMAPFPEAEELVPEVAAGPVPELPQVAQSALVLDDEVLVEPTDVEVKWVNHPGTEDKRDDNGESINDAATTPADLMSRAEDPEATLTRDVEDAARKSITHTSTETAVTHQEDAFRTSSDTPTPSAELTAIRSGPEKAEDLATAGTDAEQALLYERKGKDSILSSDDITAIHEATIQKPDSKLFEYETTDTSEKNDLLSKRTERIDDSAEAVGVHDHEGKAEAPDTIGSSNHNEDETSTGKIIGEGQGISMPLSPSAFESNIPPPTTEAEPSPVGDASAMDADPFTTAGQIRFFDADSLPIERQESTGGSLALEHMHGDAPVAINVPRGEVEIPTELTGPLTSTGANADDGRADPTCQKPTKEEKSRPSQVPVVDPRQGKEHALHADLKSNSPQALDAEGAEAPIDTDVKRNVVDAPIAVHVDDSNPSTGDFWDGKTVSPSKYQPSMDIALARDATDPAQVDVDENVLIAPESSAIAAGAVMGSVALLAEKFGGGRKKAKGKQNKIADKRQSQDDDILYDSARWKGENKKDLDDGIDADVDGDSLGAPGEMDAKEVERLEELEEKHDVQLKATSYEETTGALSTSAGGNVAESDEALEGTARQGAPIEDDSTESPILGGEASTIVVIQGPTQLPERSAGMGEAVGGLPKERQDEDPFMRDIGSDSDFRRLPTRSLPAVQEVPEAEAVTARYNWPAPAMNRDSGFAPGTPTPRARQYGQLRDSGVHADEIEELRMHTPDMGTEKKLRRSPFVTPVLREPEAAATTPEPVKKSKGPPQNDGEVASLAGATAAAGPERRTEESRVASRDEKLRDYGLKARSASASSAASELDIAARRSISNSSLGRQRTPEPLNFRPESPGIHRSTPTPPLRRIDKRMSGDLRSLRQQRSSGSISTSPSPALPPPVANESRVRAKGDEKDMADVYDGYGEGRIGSPRSPTRPHSMRRRQSMQVLELESKVEQLVAENRLLAEARAHAEQSAVQKAANVLADRDAEIESLRQSLQFLQNEVTRLTEVNDGLASANAELASKDSGRYAQMTRELDEARGAHTTFTQSLQDKDAEIAELRAQLEDAKEQIRQMQRKILESKAGDSDFLNLKDEDYFDHRCQQLCSHVQQWVLRFSKFSDMRACRSTSEINDEKTIDRLDNSVLDGSDVDAYLKDRVKRRDIFMAMTMNMIWEYVFTRYLFGMDREQRQKLKSLEKLLTEVGPVQAVRQWRAVTLTLLCKRPGFQNQRELDSEAVVQAIFQTLSKILPPPSNLEGQIQSQLRRVMREAVDLSIEMRTQRAEYMMLPPLQPEYDANGELVAKVSFDAAMMNERSGQLDVTNEELEAQQAVVRIVLFPLVVKRGNDDGVGEDKIVVCPAQVLIVRDHRHRRLTASCSDAGGASLGGHSRISLVPESVVQP
ncbi:hypothetical protein E4U60_004542 [Claviceps pazoutovae]|uniref:Involucrin repeat protein n=1 Tax=Claviceps pazoutovae TaxID=1649127 RepID=A0A9P7SJX3_9HYPO|nr:hypothetical protein E4U60_004542 [Claviceps pazoutovae]